MHSVERGESRARERRAKLGVRGDAADDGDLLRSGLLGGLERPFDKRPHDGVLVRGREVGLPLLRVLAEVAHGVEKRGLDAGEGEVEAGDAGDREAESGCRRRARAGRARGRRDSPVRAGARPCRRPPPRHRRSSPERLEGAVIATSRSSVWPPLASRHRNGGSSGSSPRKREATCACRWSTGTSGSRLPHATRLRRAQADEQRAGEPRPARDRDPLDAVEALPGFGERLVDRRDDELEVPARRDLGDDAAEPRVQLGLGGDDVGEDPPVGGYERRRGLVTGRLETEDQNTGGTQGSPVSPRLNACKRSCSS